MTLPPSSRFQLAAGLPMCRILNGMWQVSGAHGNIDPEAAVQSMFAYLDSGLTTWDLADHYGPAEDFVGEFRRRLASSRGEQAPSSLQAFTKWVPQPGRMTERVVEENVALSLRRMDVESIDLLQFHWWDYQDDGYLDAMDHLSKLRDDGKIKHLGLTNFDTEHMQRITDHGIRLVSNQVQFSLIDRRPEVRMVQFCQDNDISLLAYGTLCGGLLSEGYLGRPEPSRRELNTASLSKYKQMIDAWGGWELFQELLATLQSIASRHQVSIANVAVRYILDRPAVAGAIIGARLGVSDRREDNLRVFDFALDADDLSQIEAVLEKSLDLYQLIGDCGDEYRR
ncbi:MAG: aldo/keto reductase [Chloroflexi bacterium]|nr:aldo/keto reductase [Chloroflexota bacterium]